jgi:hypothetical protein
MASVTPASEMMPCRSERCSKVSRRTLNLDEFAADSTLEEDGFGLQVPFLEKLCRVLSKGNAER